MEKPKIMLYLDPGTGSLIIQAAIAIFVAAAATTKIYWYKLKALFTDLFSKKSKE